MNHHSTAHGSIVGLVACVPSNVITNADCPDPAAADEAAKITGVRERRWVRDGQSAYDLNLAAARRLLEGMQWPGESLDLIVYVTQTPTRAVPADVYSIAAELGATCPCVQVNYSCAGYVYGLWMTMRMLAQGQRALLLVGDATSTICDPGDRATAPLFGDAGSATAIVGGAEFEYVARALGECHYFVMGTDGSGAEKLCTDRFDGADLDYLKMDGAAVFNFTLKRVPELAAAVRAFAEPDVWLLHQANEFMLRHLAKKCNLENVPLNIQWFGNTSCASIPLLMSEGDRATWRGAKRLGLLGYGAGFAWAGASITTEPLQVCELIETP